MNDMLRDLLGRMLGRRPPALQVGALCLHPETGKVLMVTSRGTGRWIIPKGWPMDGRSTGGAALREAWEEAGVRGEVEERPLGRYSYDKKLTRGLSAPVEVQVHLVRVAGLDRDFPERKQRRRRWFSPTEAAKLVDEPGLATLMRRLPR
ncbi:NUDIX hydrolase [Paracoccus xiamenensis]|uniref:NUDIX hydrolase n=1 Tax=Paracoccus xiamenensis TaxID=2714901 RepID=UPI00140BC67E|nr:NUDIX hydrolase [Paracoccus xiamenensis]NHF73601.1 NUDIX hydrolase [Paracoccus xiamenensis]